MASQRPVTRLCKCGVEFSVSPKGPIGTRCKSCKAARTRERAKEWYYANPEIVRKRSQQWATANSDRRWEIQRRAQLKRYGLTLEDFEAWATAQGNVCAICKRTAAEANPPHRPHTLVVDHCHKTGKNRGLLCEPCNHGLGSFRDNPDACVNAALYLKTFLKELVA